MLNSKLSRVGLSYAFAALLVVAAPGVRSSFAAAASPSVKLLTSKLPRGTTLADASCKQTYEALKAAAGERPDLAVTLLRAAVVARTTDSKFTCDCALLVKLVDAVAVAAPDKTRQLAEEALSLDPECSDALDQYLTGANLPGLDPNAVRGDIGEGTFGAGFGPGFPGSPGFIGSAPGGTIALPPVGSAVTSITNG